MQKKHIPWKPIALVLAVIIAIPAVFVLTRPGQEEQPAGEEYVWVQYTASFKLLGTEDNGAIDNLFTYWPYPYVRPPIWETTNNPLEVGGTTLYLPRENIDVKYIFGEREENRENILIDSEFENWNSGTDIVNTVAGFLFGEPVENSKLNISLLNIKIPQGKMYPDDSLKVEAWFRVPRENLQKVTMINLFTENRLALFSQWEPDKTINLSVQATLQWLENGKFEVLENWTRIVEDVSSQYGIKLYRT